MIHKWPSRTRRQRAHVRIGTRQTHHTSGHARCGDHEQLSTTSDFDSEKWDGAADQFERQISRSEDLGQIMRKPDGREQLLRIVGY